MDSAYESYSNPEPIILSEGNIVIPAWQQRTMADRKFFSYKDEALNRLDVSQTIADNPRVVIEPLAKILGMIRIKSVKKPELAQFVQLRIVFSCAASAPPDTP
jgi:hypothetical protein